MPIVREGRYRDYWPRFLGPAPTLNELNVICWGCFLAFLVLPVGRILWSHGLASQSQDVDFVYFYGEGRILNQYPPARLYDYELQKAVFTRIHPLSAGMYGPSPYPPFVGMFFRLFALAPFPVAYAVWVAICLALYLAGLRILIRQFDFDQPLERSLIYCLALAFYPFFLKTLWNGQLSAIGFCAIAWAMKESRAGRPFLSGLALSICLYKPTLLLLLVPMLLVARRWRPLLGLVVGGASLVLLATAVEGAGVWSGYLDILFSLRRASAGMQARWFTMLWTYIDLNAFAALLPGGRWATGAAMLAACCAAVALVRLWWRSARDSDGAGTLMWAATLTWTLLLNVYVPIYDSILVVLSVVATLGVWKEHPELGRRGWFHLLWILILASSWLTERIAGTTGVQLMTILLAALGALQVWMAGRVGEKEMARAAAGSTGQ